MNYDGTPITNLTAKEGMEQPVNYWVPRSRCPSIAFYKGAKFPKWDGQLFLGALAQEELRRWSSPTARSRTRKCSSRTSDACATSSAAGRLHLRELRWRPRRPARARTGRSRPRRTSRTGFTGSQVHRVHRFGIARIEPWNP
jgi:hypothetical protein